MPREANLLSRWGKLGRGGAAIFLDLIFNVSLGLAFALCARDRVRADGPFSAPAFLMVLAFVGAILVPTTLYLYLAHPAWTWMYVVDPAKVPGLALLPLLVAHGGAVVLGWWIGSRLVAAGRARAVASAAAGGGALVLLGVALSWGRLGRYGSYDDFVDGRALPIMDVKLGYVLVAVLIGVTAAAGFTAYELVRDSRRVRSR